MPRNQPENHLQNVPMFRFQKNDTLQNLILAAQTVYDAWDQDSDGIDLELGTGGICQDIAEAMQDVLIKTGIESRSVDNEGIVEQHVWIVFKHKNKYWELDIPPHIYETGSGYVWHKKPDVVFHVDHLCIQPASPDYAEIFRE